MLVCRHIAIGKGTPKICIPIVGSCDEDILMQLSVELPYDMIELRIDYYNDLSNLKKVKDLLSKVRSELDCPILFTCRSQDEGGKSLLNDEQYINVLKVAIESGFVDLIDIEINKTNKTIYILKELAHKHNVKVVMSYHNFDKTPTQQDMIDILEKMEVMGGDILKIAVMPLCKKDVVSLMDVSLMMSTRLDKPLIMISMGELGKITRVAGELIGSSITFGSAKKSSAPGQIQVNDLKLLLESIHS